MEYVHITIGEHALQIGFKSDLLRDLFQRSFPSIELKPPGTHPPDLNVDLEDGYGVPFTDYRVAVAKDRHKITYRRADYFIEADHRFRQARICVHNEFALKHALMNLYSSYIVHTNWGLLVHSSCVAEAGVAHMFAGRSGAGKSTAACLSSPRGIVADEATVVKIGSGSGSEPIAVFHSPFRSEMQHHGCAVHGPLQLGSIQLLRQAARNQRARLAAPDAFLQLMDKVFYWSRFPEEARQVLCLLRTLAVRVPVYELHFQKNPSFWELIS